MTDIGITREDALELLRSRLKSEVLVKHCLATEAIMRDLAEKKGGDPEVWGIAGLLHDLDYERTADDPSRHGLASAEMLEGSLPESALQAIRSHNAELNGTERVSDLDWLLSAGESITGLIVAVALVYPGRKLEPVKLKSVLKRMNVSGFARSVSRERIRECSEAGYELRDFASISLESMKGIAAELGL